MVNRLQMYGCALGSVLFGTLWARGFAHLLGSIMALKPTALASNHDVVIRSDHRRLRGILEMLAAAAEIRDICPWHAS